MKRLSFLLCILTICITAYRCNNKTVPADGILKGKLVIKELCGHYVVQVQNAKLDTSLVSNGWRDDKRNKTYDNVFTVSNRCGFADAALKEGDDFEFQFDKNPPPEDCLVCMAFYPTPRKQNVVRVLKLKK
jgi:hypothetical protein